MFRYKCLIKDIYKQFTNNKGKYQLPYQKYQMGFPYIIELQNVDTNQKIYHQINNSKPDQVFNDKEEINYNSILQFILMYEPQCDKQMLLIMYLENDYWIFMTSEFFLDLNKISNPQEQIDKAKISKFGSKINTSQIDNPFFNSSKHPQKSKIILSIRFQCQLWVDEPENFWEKSLNTEKSCYSQKESSNANLMQKVKQISSKINQIDQFAHELQQIEAQALGINIFWASPYYATDGILRKQPKGQQKKKQDIKQGKRDFLKNAVKCIPYVNAITQQILQSNKKVVLNIDQFNNLSFARRNIFKVVYLICHTQVTQIKPKQYENKFKRNANQFFNDNASTISDVSFKNQFFGMDQIRVESIKVDKLEHIAQRNEEENEMEEDSTLNVPKHMIFKRTDSIQIEDNSFLGLQRIDEEKESDNMTERKQSIDFAALRENDLIYEDKLTQLHRVSTEQKKPHLFIEEQILRQKQKMISEESYLEKAFNINGDNIFFSDYQQDQFQFEKTKVEMSKPRKNRLSRSNSIKSVSSVGKDKSKRSKSKRNIDQQSSKNIPHTYKQEVQSNQQPEIQFELKHSAIKRNKKYDKKQKKQYKKTLKTVQTQNQQKQQKQAFTYLIGENKLGQLQKITPEDLDEMLNEKKLENIELFIIHTSYPYAHLPILKKHANNILVINSNPMFPEACTVFYLKYFFKYLFQLKNIRLAHEKSLLHTSYLYKGEKFDFYMEKMVSLYPVEKESLQRIHFEPFMETINKKYIHGGPYLCCCYHKHEFWCLFKTNKSTSKYAECHYKFHINRCECKFNNLMDHGCESKRQTLGTYNIIDKKKYLSPTVYDCCCLGVRLGKYKNRRKNIQCTQIINEEIFEDPHDISQKYLLLKSYEDENQPNDKTTILDLQKNSTQDVKKKQFLEIQDGVVQGSCNAQFLNSLKYLSENDLIGNTQIIVESLAFFGGNYEGASNESEIRGDIELKRNQSRNSSESILTSMTSSQKPQKMTNSMIKQSVLTMPKNQKNQTKNIYSNQPRICNLHGENSSGRKTIGKYLANLMIVKNMFDKIQIKYFTKVQDLKFIEIEQKTQTIFILVYKSAKKHQQINLNQIALTAQNLPPSINAIIVTNKKIYFDKSIIHVYKTPKPFNKEQIQTYIKMYEHLSSQQKTKLKTFMDLTDLSIKEKNKTEDQNEQNITKIYANRIDPYEIISIVRKSNYENAKFQKYLESVSKIHSRSLPQYIFIAGTLFEALKYFDSFDSKYMKKQKSYFTTKITQKLKEFITENKSFYLFFDPKRNKNKSKKPLENNKKLKIQKETEKESQMLEKEQTFKTKQSQSQQQKIFKEDVIKCIDITQFFSLIFQKFRKQISSRPLDALKYFIFYTTLHENNVFSLKESHYSKGSQNLHKQKSSQDIANYLARNIVYDNQFYEATSKNKNSFLYKVLRRQIEEYGQLFLEKKVSNQNRNSEGLNHNGNCLKNEKEEDKNLISLVRLAKQTNEEILQHQKNSLNQFFTFYSCTLKEKNQIKNRNSYERKQPFSPTNLFMKQRDSLLTPHRELYKSPTSKHSKPEVCFLTVKQKKSQNLTDKKGHAQKEERKSKKLNFQKEESHLYCIMSAGLTYLRGIVCSHLVYNLLESRVILKIIRAGLVLINNALILMKTPHFKQIQNETHIQESSNSQCDSNEMHEMSSDHLNQELDTFEAHPDEINILPQNFDPLRTKSSYLGFSQTMRLKSTNQQKKNIEKLEAQLNQLFSVKGLLYLLFKIRERCDGLILIFTNQNSRDQIQQVTKLCIVSELLILQLHLMNLSKGENYENAILKQNTLQKSEKYLTQIFYDKSRSLNYIRESLHFVKFKPDEEQMIQNHFLSAYIMIATNYGRKKINESLSQEINKIKSEFDDKSGRKDSIHEIALENKIDECLLSDKMKILLKISQNKETFLKVLSIFMNFNLDQAIIQSHLQSSRKRSNQNNKMKSQEKVNSQKKNRQFDQNISRVYSNRTKHHHYETQNEVFLELVGIFHKFQQSIHEEDSAHLYLSLQKYKTYLLKDEIQNALTFCSRYVNEFHSDLLHRIHKHNMLLKEKFVLFFTADPIQFSKSTFLSSSKEHFESNQQFEINKKKIQFQGNNKTIILGCDVSELNRKIGFKHPHENLNRDSVLERTFLDEGTKTNVNESVSKKNFDYDGKATYNYFTLNKKLNQHNLKELSKSLGCKYLCIDTTMCLNNQKNEIIGETQEGEMLIFKKQRLTQLIQQVSANVLFICLHNGYLANELIEKWTKKEIVYFNFQKISQNVQKKLQRKVSSSSHSSSSSNTKLLKSGMLYTYYRMIMRKVVHLIIQKLVQDTSAHSHTWKLAEALSYVLDRYEFCIKNQLDQIVFHLSNSQLRDTVFSTSKFKLDSSQMVGPPILITLFEEDIVSIEEVQQVKTVLKHKYNTSREFKVPIKIQHINSFQKFFKIFKFYLKDKQNYQEFFEIDLQKFKYPIRDRQTTLSLSYTRSGQSNPCIPETLSREESNISNESAERRKREKKNKEPKYANRWKSQFIKYLLKQNLLNLFLSNKKSFVMFSNSDLMAQKGQKQDWAKNIFDNLFKIDNCDTGEQLNRIVTQVKIGIPKKGEKKLSKVATLFFMETKKSQNQ